jgi:hypothetical protein
MEDMSFDFVQMNLKEILMALFPDMTEFNNTEADIPISDSGGLPSIRDFNNSNKPHSS